MIDYSLKFVDEAQATTVLFTEDGPVYPNTDVVGTICRPTGAVDAEGNEQVAPIPGWHVNVRTLEEVPELEAYRLYPANPVRVWASGGMGAGAPLTEVPAVVETTPV